MGLARENEKLDFLETSEAKGVPGGELGETTVCDVDLIAELLALCID